MTRRRARPTDRFSRFGTAFAATLAALLAACSTGAPARSANSPIGRPKPNIALGAKLADEALDGNVATTIPLGPGAQLLVGAGAVKDGTKVLVREVLGASDGFGGLTVADRVLDIAVSGKVLSQLKVLYEVKAPPAGAPEPAAGELDKATGRWTPIDGAYYDAANGRLEVPVRKSASVGHLEWNWPKAISGASEAVKALIPAADGTNAQCERQDDVNGRYDVVVSTVASISWCAGVDSSRDVLHVRNRGRLPVAILTSAFVFDEPITGAYGYVDQLARQLADNRSWLLPPGQQVRVLAPGSELVLQHPGMNAAEVTAEIDGFSQHVATLAVAAEVAAAIFAGQGMAAHEVLTADTPIRTSLFRKLTSAQCTSLFGDVDQSQRDIAVLSDIVGQIVTTCIGSDLMRELSQSSKSTGNAVSDSANGFAPSDPSALPEAFAQLVATGVRPTVEALTQRPGQPQLGRVVMQPQAITATSSTGPTTSRPGTAPTTTEPATTTPSVATSPSPTTTDVAITTVATTAPTTAPTTAAPTTTLPATTTSTTVAEPTTTTTTTPVTVTTVVTSLNLPGLDQLLCPGTGRITQPFVVPNGVTELDAITVGTTGTFVADLDIVDTGGVRLTSKSLVAGGSDATSTLGRLKVTSGATLQVVVSNVRRATDPVPLRFTTADALAGTTVVVNDGCPTLPNRDFTVTDLAMAITGA